MTSFKRKQLDTTSNRKKKVGSFWDLLMSDACDIPKISHRDLSTGDYLIIGMEDNSSIFVCKMLTCIVERVALSGILLPLFSDGLLGDLIQKRYNFVHITISHGGDDVLFRKTYHFKHSPLGSVSTCELRKCLPFGHYRLVKNTGGKIFNLPIVHFPYEKIRYSQHINHCEKKIEMFKGVKYNSYRYQWIKHNYNAYVVFIICPILLIKPREGGAVKEFIVVVKYHNHASYFVRITNAQFRLLKLLNNAIPGTSDYLTYNDILWGDFVIRMEWDGNKYKSQYTSEIGIKNTPKLDVLKLNETRFYNQKIVNDEFVNH